LTGPNPAIVTIADSGDSSTTMVAVSAPDYSDAEANSDSRYFTFTRYGGSSNALTLSVSISGSATLGTDYPLSPTT